jgi:type IV pilus assembly protein PilO
MAMNLTLNDIKKMSTKAKVAAAILIILLIGYFDWFYFLSSAIEEKTSLDENLTVMQGKLKDKKEIAKQIDKYMADVAVLKENYKTALQKLPDQREIPALFHSVALAGKDTNVEFQLFEPKAAVPKVLEKQPSGEPKAAALVKPSDQKQSEQKPAGNPADASNAKQQPAAADSKKAAAPPPPEPFYEEIPVGVNVIGTFQNILSFFEKVAKLPRIINVSDIVMGDIKDVKGRGQLITASCTIKTYMFIDKKEKVSEKIK